MNKGKEDRRVLRQIFGLVLCVGVAFSAAPTALAQNLASPNTVVQGVAAPSAPAVVNGVAAAASDRIMVQATPCFCRAVAQALPNGAPGFSAAAHAAMSPGLDAACRQWGVTNIRPAFRFGFAHPELAAKYGLDQIFVFETAPGTDTAAMAADFATHTNDIVAASVSAIGGVGAVIPDDTDFGIQWGMDNDGTVPSGNLTCVADADVDAPEAWEISTGNLVDPIVIAIIDSGVEPHAEFAGRMVPGISTGDADPTDTGDDCSIFHGTHVAGIAAASGNNGIGVAGMCWNCQIMPVDVLFDGFNGNGCSGFTIDLANGITWAADHGADVINMSLQFYNLPPLDTVILQNAVRYANDLDIVIVAATGNDNFGGVGVISFPAVFPETIAVGGTTCQDRRANRNSFAAFTSNSGPEIDVSAPGDRVWSTSANDGYRFISGTSMATPHVTGLAALILSVEPGMANTAVARLLKETADDIEDVGWDELSGYGRVNAFSALLAAPDYPRVMSSDPPSGAIDARRPFDPNDAAVVYGWDSVEMTFPSNAAGVVPEDFRVVRSGVTASVAPAIASIDVMDDQHIRVNLDRPIEPGTWVSIVHKSSKTRVDLGFMPGDVDGDTIAAPSDILALVDALNGIVDPLAMWSADVDRSGIANPADILDVIDLLNGAGQFDAYLNQRLPVIEP